MPPKSTEEKAKQTTAYYVKAYGENPIPPMALSALIASMHIRPWRTLPMLFIVPLTFSSYMNVAGYKVDSAGTMAAWSGLYALLAERRGQGFVNKFGARGLVRGATLGLCAANVVGGGWAWLMGRRKNEELN